MVYRIGELGVMSLLDNLSNKPKTRKLAIIAALLGTVTPLAGIHKFYLGQPLWGVIYVLLWSTPIPRIACAIEAVWYLAQDQEQFDRRFNSGTIYESSTIAPERVGAIAEALRELDQLRLDGLLSEYEFEQKRRQLIDRIV